MKPRTPRSIIVVEDSQEDFEILQFACKSASIELTLVRCENGEEAIDCLNGYGKYSGFLPPPALVLLDLNLPLMSGKEVLRHIKTSNRLKTLPVLIFSSSSSLKDIADCYREGASSYIVKPLGLAQTRVILETLTRYWLQIVELTPEVERYENNSETTIDRR